MSRVTHLSNGKSVMILGTVVLCLIILWPKIFYPMLQNGFQGDNRDVNVKSKVHPRMMASKSPPKGFNTQSNFHGPNAHIPPTGQNTISGVSVGLIMTIYTIGIIFLFFYTIFKYISSEDSSNYLLDDEAYCKSESHERKKKGETITDKIDHQQGECLKKLAVNYVRCKLKLSEDDEHPIIGNDEDGVSMAYRTLLGDMMELRDYLSDLQCSINGCESCYDQFCNSCSDGIVYNPENYEPETKDFGFDVEEAINQMFGQDNTDQELELSEQLDEKSEEVSFVETSDDQIDSSVENVVKKLRKFKNAREE